MTRRIAIWVPFALLLLLWGTVAALPFRVFAETIGQTAGNLAGRIGLTGTAAAGVIYLAMLGISALLLGLLRTKYRVLLAGICMFAAAVLHLIGSFSAHRFDRTSIALIAGLAVVLLCLILKADRVSVWLGGVFGAAPGVLLLYDMLLIPILDRLFPDRVLPSFLNLDTEPLLRGLLRYAPAVWWLVPIGMMVLFPVVYLLLSRSGQRKSRALVIR